MKPRVFVSIGDPNGVGPEIALRAHDLIKAYVQPLYGVDAAVLEEASALLGIAIPKDFHMKPLERECKINPSTVSAEAGAYSYASFQAGLDSNLAGETEALITLPIHKKAWQLAGIPHAGHTEALRAIFGEEAIMMMGREGFFIALFTDHIPLSLVAQKVKKASLVNFLTNLAHAIPDLEVCGVLGLNPHAGDYGLLGSEEEEIAQAIDEVNHHLGRELFAGPLVPDAAFTPRFRERYRYYVAMYHDQALPTLKALYFDSSVNISLGIPIVRVSVDHGTAMDIAYCQTGTLSTQSYQEAVRSAARMVKQ